MQTLKTTSKATSRPTSAQRLAKKSGKSVKRLRPILVVAVAFGVVGSVLIVSSFASPARPGDLNKDGVINQKDVDQMLATWSTDKANDLNGDGSVNSQDLSILVSKVQR